jgi:hypothetical protein
MCVCVYACVCVYVCVVCVLCRLNSNSHDVTFERALRVPYEAGQQVAANSIVGATKSLVVGRLIYAPTVLLVYLVLSPTEEF